jgi:hypothetical protein
MSIEQKRTIIDGLQWAIKVLLVVLAWFATTTFMQIRDDIHQLSNDVTSIKERLIRVETKLEQEEHESRKSR